MQEIKPLFLRINKELINFIKKKSIDREISTNKLVTELIENYKRKCEKKLDGK